MSKVRDHSKHRHLLRLFCLFVVVATFFASAIVFALRGKPFFLIFGIVSFGAVFVVVCILLLLYVLLQSIYLRRHHPGLWKKSFFSTSLGERIEASRKIRSLQIPFLILLNKKKTALKKDCLFLMSEKGDLNPRHPPWQGGALPLSYSPKT